MVAHSVMQPPSSRPQAQLVCKSVTPQGHLNCNTHSHPGKDTPSTDKHKSYAQTQSANTTCENKCQTRRTIDKHENANSGAVVGDKKIFVFAQCMLTGNWYLYVRRSAVSFPVAHCIHSPACHSANPLLFQGVPFGLDGGASYILTSLLTSRMANLLLDCCSQNIQCDNHRSKSCYHLHVMLLQKALQSSSIQQLNS